MHHNFKLDQINIRIANVNKYHGSINFEVLNNVFNSMSLGV